MNTGCAYLIGMYYKRFELQKRLVFFFSSSLVAGAFGGVGKSASLFSSPLTFLQLLAFALVKMNKLGGYAGWRWYVEVLSLIAHH